MRKIFLFMMVSVNGYFEGANHDLSWHNADSEFESFVDGEQNPQISTLLFGRRTYDMMASFWPTPKGQGSPKTAKFMNKTDKVVVSHERFKPAWENTAVVNDNVMEEVRKLKEGSGKDIAIFGSNNLCVQLMEAGLVDEFRIMVNPVALEASNLLFTGLSKRMKLKLIRTRAFKSGNVLNYYVLA